MMPVPPQNEENAGIRCWWSGSDQDYVHYHDHEWGRPVVDDHRLFEKICLEGFQAGLSWLTILRKRESFRSAFVQFDFEQVAHFGEQDVERLLQNASIVRHRKKIESTINNAKRAVEMVKREGSLANFFWSFVPDDAERPEDYSRDTLAAVTQTPTSARLSRTLKEKGWSFVGPTTAYAFMQAMGLVNDHVAHCCVRDAVEAERQSVLTK